MFLYTVLTIPAALIAGILLAACTKKRPGLVYGRLDKIGFVTNIALIPLYACFLPLSLFIGMVSSPEYDGFLGVIGWIVSVINGSAALFCGLGLGASVALRKKGRSLASFLVQFAGVLGILLSFVLYDLCEPILAPLY